MGHGGTLVIDPPKEQFNFDIKPAATNFVTPSLAVITKNDAFEFVHAAK